MDERAAALLEVLRPPSEDGGAVQRLDDTIRLRTQVCDPELGTLGYACMRFPLCCFQASTQTQVGEPALRCAVGCAVMQLLGSAVVQSKMPGPQF